MRSYVKSVRKFAAMTMKTYWWSAPCENYVYNFGDLLTPLLLNAYGLIEYTEPDLNHCAGTNYVLVGSLLQSFWDNHPLTVLGCGLLYDQRKTFTNARILALRGKLTKDRLGVTRDVTLGDPGLLISKILPVSASSDSAAKPTGIVPHLKHWASKIFPAFADSAAKPIGIVPHWKHYASPRLDRYRNDPRYKMINPRCEPESIVHELNSCSFIIASSLHALIFADAYGIPNKRMTFHDGLNDVADFKYLDYFSAIDRAGEYAEAITPEDIAMFEPENHMDMPYRANVLRVQDELNDLYKSFTKEIRTRAIAENWKPVAQSDDFETALREAQNGNVDRMNYIGDCYYEGKQVPESKEQAYFWWKAAADRGFHWGMFNLGKWWHHVKHNDAEARKWYEMAAHFGNVWAVERLALELNDRDCMKMMCDYRLNGGAEEQGCDVDEGRAWYWLGTLGEANTLRMMQFGGAPSEVIRARIQHIIKERRRI